MDVEITPYSPSFIGGGNLGVLEECLAAAIRDLGTGLQRLEIRLLLTSLPLAPRRHAVDDITPEESDALLHAIAPEAVGWGHPEWIVPHEQHRARGEKVMFRRSAATVFATVLSDLSEHDVHAADTASEANAAIAVGEIVAVLEPLRRRVKVDDEFDVDRLLVRLAALAEPPGTS